MCRSVPMGTYNLSKGTHYLDRVMGPPSHTAGYIGTDMRLLVCGFFTKFSLTTRLTFSVQQAEGPPPI